jgi:putative transposase
VACRVLQVSTSGYYAWRDRPGSARERSNLELVQIIRDTLRDPRHTYGSPRVHAELRLGKACGRVCSGGRLLRTHRIVGVHRRRRRGCTVRDPHPHRPGCPSNRGRP